MFQNVDLKKMIYKESIFEQMFYIYVLNIVFLLEKDGVNFFINFIGMYIY